MVLVCSGCGMLQAASSPKEQIEIVSFDESSFIDTLCSHSRAYDSQFIMNFAPSATLEADVENAIKKAQSSRFDCAYNVDSIVWSTVDHENYIYSNFKMIYSAQAEPRPPIAHINEISWPEIINNMLEERRESYSLCIPANEISEEELVSALRNVSQGVDQALFAYTVEENQLTLGSYEDYLVPTLSFKYKEDAALPSSIYHIESAYAAAEYIMEKLSGGEEKLVLYVKDMTKEQLQLLLWAAQINDSSDMVEEALAGSGDYYENSDGSYIAVLSITYSGTLSEREEHRLSLKSALHEIEQEIRYDLPRSDEGLYKAIAEAIASRAAYDYEMSEASVDEKLTPEMRFLRTAYGAVCDGRAVCTSYASAFKALCDRFSLPCWVMMGNYDESGHAWNCVLLNGEVKYVDATFFDLSHDGQFLLFSESQYRQRPYELEKDYVMPDWYDISQSDNAA